MEKRRNRANDFTLLLLAATLGIAAAFAPGVQVQSDTVNWTDVAPTWSVDGQTIYFYSYRDGNAELYRMDPDGGNQTRLTHTEHHEWWMQPMKDGNRILVASDKDSAEAFGGANLYILDLTSGAFERITNEPGNGWASFPRLAQDAGVAVYVRSDAFGLNVPVEIWVADLNEGIQYQYPDNPEHQNYAASISNDGQSVFYASKRNGKSGIYVNNLTATDEKQLYEVDGRVDAISASPDGQWLAFSIRAAINVMARTEDGGPEQQSAQREIYIARTDGSAVRRLTSSASMNMDPSWSPDSQTVAFGSTRLGFMDVFSINIDGTNERNLTRTSIQR